MDLISLVNNIPGRSIIVWIALQIYQSIDSTLDLHIFTKIAFSIMLSVAMGQLWSSRYSANPSRVDANEITLEVSVLNLNQEMIAEPSMDLLINKDGIKVMKE